MKSPGFKKPTALDPRDLARSSEISLCVSLGSVLDLFSEGLSPCGGRDGHQQLDPRSLPDRDSLSPKFQQKPQDCALLGPFGHMPGPEPATAGSMQPHTGVCIPEHKS